MNVLIVLTDIYLSDGISPHYHCDILSVCNALAKREVSIFLQNIISLPFGVIEYIYQTNCMFVTTVAANVSVLVVSLKIQTGIENITLGMGLLTETLHSIMSFD